MCCTYCNVVYGSGSILSMVQAACHAGKRLPTAKALPERQGTGHGCQLARKVLLRAKLDVF